MVTVRVTLPVGPDRSDGSAEGLGVAGAGVSDAVEAVGVGGSDGSQRSKHRPIEHKLQQKGN